MKGRRRDNNNNYNNNNNNNLFISPLVFTIACNEFQVNTVQNVVT